MNTYHIEDFLKNRELFENNIRHDDLMSDLGGAVSKANSLYNLFVNQVVMLKFGENLLPVIVTNVNPPDINLHNTYDYVILCKGDCEFASTIFDTERYLWRFISKDKISKKSAKYLLDALSEYNEIDIDVTDLFFINDNKINSLSDYVKTELSDSPLKSSSNQSDSEEYQNKLIKYHSKEELELMLIDLKSYGNDGSENDVANARDIHCVENALNIINKDNTCMI